MAAMKEEKAGYYIQQVFKKYGMAIDTIMLNINITSDNGGLAYGFLY